MFIEKIEESTKTIKKCELGMCEYKVIWMDGGGKICRMCSYYGMDKLKIIGIELITCPSDMEFTMI